MSGRNRIGQYFPKAGVLYIISVTTDYPIVSPRSSRQYERGIFWSTDWRCSCLGLCSFSTCESYGSLPVCALGTGVRPTDVSLERYRNLFWSYELSHRHSHREKCRSLENRAYLWYEQRALTFSAVNSTETFNGGIDGGASIALADRQDVRAVSNTALLGPERFDRQITLWLVAALPVVLWFCRSQALYCSIASYTLQNYASIFCSGDARRSF